MGIYESYNVINVLTQRCKDINVDIYDYFIDFCKAFNIVRQEKLRYRIPEKNTH